jgi:tRNA modification GTPase
VDAGGGLDGGVRDTIVARATPEGRGALALVRLSGPGVRSVLAAVGAGRVLDRDPRTAVLAPLRDPENGALLDRGLVTFFAGPASYTGEDVAEIGIHGGPVVVGRVLEACRRAGARAAEPGEFTRRAWLEGRLDRLQVEAVQDLVEADSPARHRVAVHQVEGGLSRRLEALREDVLRVEALLAHHLDFPDEDEPPTPAEALIEALEDVNTRIGRLLATAPGGRLLREGATVVLAGRPNAGKSALFNALVGEERALVTRHAGTTRDAVDAFVALDGFPFRIVDTAGLRAGADEVEALGIEVAERWIERASVVIWCRAGSEGPPEEAEIAGMRERTAGGGRPRTLVPVRTMSDLDRGGRGAEAEAWPVPGAAFPGPASEDRGGGAPGWIRASVVDGTGLAELRGALVAAAFGGLAGAEAPDPGSVLVRERHREALERASREIEAAAGALRDAVPAEFAATHLAAAEEALLELIGPVGGDEVLDVLFRSFCIGK